MENNDLELTIKQIIDKYSLLANKGKSRSLGQNFLCDYSLLRKIVSCAFPFSDNQDIVEIGSGPGGLTRAIMELSLDTSKVFCIEKDLSLKEVHNNLKKCYEKDKLEFIYADALDIRVLDITKKEIVIIANLPYNVGTQLLINWFHDIQNIGKMILLFQKEVANRITAKTGGKDYGRLSIISQLLCYCEKVFDISNRAFYPPPKVTSTVVKLIPKKNITFNFEKFEKITAICFQQRRKTVFNSMKNHYDNEKLAWALIDSGINKTDRPETISPEKFLQLHNKL